MALSDNEIRDINKYLSEGKTLPDKYRFLLFEEKRQVELVWNGKTNDITNVVLPFQIIEQVDEPRAESAKRIQMRLFDVDARGRQKAGWTNKLIWGDNKLILSSLKNGPLREEIQKQGGIKLIYIDPPFDVGADFSMDIEVGDEKESITKQPSVLEELAYRDTWGKGADSFIQMIYERLQLMKDLLADNGSIYVHCDYRVSALIHLVLNEIFDESNFRSEIIWKQTRAKSTGFNNYGLEHNNIYYYTKSDDFVWNMQHKEYDEDKFDRYYCYFEQKDGTYTKYGKAEMGNFRRTGKYPQGRQFALIPLQRFMEGARPNLTYEYKGFLETWSTSKEKMIENEKLGLIVQTSPTAVPQKKQYYDEMEGVKIGTLWDDVFPVNSQAKEKVDYPTQKPEALLERIIEASSSKGDIVADFFVGSGSTLAVAERLGRKWIGADIGKFAIHTTRKRLIKVQRDLKDQEKDYRAFEILNLGKYERQYYVGANSNLHEEEKHQQIIQKEKDFVNLILYAYRAEKVEGFKTFQGKKANRLVSIGPINTAVTRLFVDSIISEAKKKQVTKVDVLAFEFEMGLAPNIQEDAKVLGIDLSLKYIPREVFDKRAVEKNQVVFNDVSYIEVKPVIKGRSITVELTDFSVFYNQDALANIEEDIKDGGHKIIIENGQIVKVLKDKNGITTKDVLTKKWTDWVDYWSVDFNFENKKEVIKVMNDDGKIEEVWTGSYIFENEWQSFRTKKDRSLELVSMSKECLSGNRKIAVKVIDIFGNDTMKVIDVNIGGK